MRVISFSKQTDLELVWNKPKDLGFCVVSNILNLQLLSCVSWRLGRATQLYLWFIYGIFLVLATFITQLSFLRLYS